MTMKSKKKSLHVKMILHCNTMTVMMMIKKSFTFMALLNTFSNNFGNVIFNTSCHYKMTKSMDKL